MIVFEQNGQTTFGSSMSRCRQIVKLTDSIFNVAQIWGTNDALDGNSQAGAIWLFATGMNKEVVEFSF